MANPSPTGVSDPTLGSESDLIPAFRRAVLARLRLAVLILGAAAFAPALPSVLQGQIPLAFAVLYALAFALLLLFSLLGGRLPFQIRAYGLQFVLLLLGAAGLLQFGAQSTGPLWLLASCLLGSLLFGPRAGLFSGAISLAILAGAGWLIIPQQLPFLPSLADQTVALWLAVGLILATIEATVVIALGALQNQLEAAFQKERRMISQLKEQQGLLEHRIDRATRDAERRTLYVETAATIARLAAEGLEPQDLMDRAVDAVRDGFGAYHTSIFLIDESGTWATLVASTGEAGRRLLSSRHRLSVGSASIIGWTTAHRQVRISSDVEQDPYHFKNPFLPDTRSEVALPLFAGHEMIGALDVQSTGRDAFGAEDVKSLEAVASQLAVAIENARLLGERALLAEDMEDEHRERVRENWQKLTRAGDPLVLKLGAQKGDEDIQASELALRSGETSMLPLRGEVAVPIRIRGEVVATIAARKRGEGDSWTEEDIALLEAVAGQAGLALETARQYTEEQRRVAELEVINRISQAASQMLQPETLFHILHSQINQVMDKVDLTVAVYDLEEDELRFPYATRRGNPVDLPRAALGDTPHSLVVRSHQPLLLVHDATQEAQVLGARVEQPFARSWLGVPMLAGEEVIGLIIVEDLDQDERFTEDDAALLSTIAGQVATALQNLRLLQQVQRVARRERLIHEITSKVRRSTDIHGILETTAREVGRALNATKATVRLANEPAGDGMSEEETSGNGGGAAPAQAPPGEDLSA